MGRIRKTKLRKVISIEIEEDKSMWPGLYIKVKMRENKIITSGEFFGPYYNQKRCSQDFYDARKRAKWIS